MTEETRISVKIQPGASRNEVLGLQNDVLRIKIAAPPEKGKANKELVDFLSERLDIARAVIEIVSGYTSRQKVIAVKGLSKQEIIKRLLPQANLL